MKTMIIYHAHCIDGITSATVVTKYLTERTDTPAEAIILCSMSYDDSLEELKKSILTEEVEHLFIVDFSFPRADLFDLYELVPINRIELYDHHASAFRNLMGEDYIVNPTSREEFKLEYPETSYERYANIKIVLDNDECGASLCWKELMGTGKPTVVVREEGKLVDVSLPTLISYVKDYDLWRFDLPDTKYVNKALKSLTKDVGVYTSLLIAFDDPNFESNMIREGKVLMGHEDKLEDSIISDCVSPITINGIQGLAVNAPYAFASNIGHKLALQSKSFGAVWVQKSDGLVSFSLRSNGDECDVSALAELMGGGGHKNAAGFTLKSPAYKEDTGITLWSEPADKKEDEGGSSSSEGCACAEQEHEITEEDGATNG